MEDLYMDKAWCEFECNELEMRCEHLSQELQEIEASIARTAETRDQYQLKAESLFPEVNDIQRR